MKDAVKNSLDQITKTILALVLIGLCSFSIPVFAQETDRLPYRNLNSRIVEEFPKEYLISTDEFNTVVTKDGKFYHGTSEINAVKILNDGFIESANDPYYGKGVFTSKDFQSVIRYAKPNGSVIGLKLEYSPNIRILNFKYYFGKSKPYKGSEHYRNAVINAEKAGLELNDYLTKRFGIDIIVNEDRIIIKNKAAIHVANSLAGKVVEGKPIEFKSPGTMADAAVAKSSKSYIGKINNFIGGANTLLSIAAIPLMVHELLQESIIGWDCNAVEDSLNTLRCKWEAKLNPSNNNLICDLYQKKIEGAEACGVSGIRYSFIVNDSDSKGLLKNSSLMDDNGLPIQKNIQEDPVGLIQFILLIQHINIDGSIQYQPIEFTPAGDQRL